MQFTKQQFELVGCQVMAAIACMVYTVQCTCNNILYDIIFKIISIVCAMFQLNIFLHLLLHFLLPLKFFSGQVHAPLYNVSNRAQKKKFELFKYDSHALIKN